MLRAVLDTTILVSAFLNPIPGGVSFELLRFAKDEAYALYIPMTFLMRPPRRSRLMSAFAAAIAIPIQQLSSTAKNWRISQISSTIQLRCRSCAIPTTT